MKKNEEKNFFYLSKNINYCTKTYCTWLTLFFQFLFPVELENFSECLNVCLGHLQGFEFGELPVVSQVGDVFPEPLERVVEAVHPFPLPGIGRKTAFLFHLGQQGSFAELPLGRSARLGRVAAVGQVQVVVVLLLLPVLIVLGLGVEVAREAGVAALVAASREKGVVS